MIVGCETYGKSAAQSSAGPSPSGAAPSAESGNALVKTSGVPVGSGVIVWGAVICLADSTT